MNEIKLVVFDMDGLLVDSEIVYFKGWQVAANKLGIDLPKEVLKGFAGKGSHKVNSILELLMGDFDKVMELRRVREEYIALQVQQKKMVMKPYAKAVLKSLKSNNIQTAVASSSHKERGMAILESLELFELLDFVTFGDEVKKLKPYPDVYEEVMKRAGISFKHTLAVEDSATGATAAKNAQLSIIHVPDTSFEQTLGKLPDNIVATGVDLREVLISLNL
jgi:putative hydrolase of the HAD superfamily